MELKHKSRYRERRFLHIALPPLVVIGLILAALVVAPGAPSGAMTLLGGQGASRPDCVRDVNGNDVGDVVDIMATAAAPDCRVYLPVVVARWRQPWNLLRNPGFEERLAGWTAGYYAPPFQVQGVRRIDDGAWHTVGLVYKRPWLRLYVDGVQEAEVNVDLVDFEGFGAYTIGAHSRTDSTANFRGYLDDLFVAARALTATQVLEYHTTLHRTLTVNGAAQCVITVNGRYYRASRPAP